MSSNTLPEAMKHHIVAFVLFFSKGSISANFSRVSFLMCSQSFCLNNHIGQNSTFFTEISALVKPWNFEKKKLGSGSDINKKGRDWSGSRYLSMMMGTNKQDELLPSCWRIWQNQRQWIGCCPPSLGNPVCSSLGSTQSSPFFAISYSVLGLFGLSLFSSTF